MDRPHLGFQPVFPEKSFDQFLLLYEGRDDSDLPPRVFLQIGQDRFRFGKGSVLVFRYGIRDVNEDQGFFFFDFAFDFQAASVEFLVIEGNDFFVTAVMGTEENRFCDDVDKLINPVNRVLQIIVVVIYAVFGFQFFVVIFVEQDDRSELLGIPKEHQVPSAENRKQGGCRIALACFVNYRKIEMGVGGAQPAGRNVRRDDDRKNPEKELQI